MTKMQKVAILSISLLTIMSSAAISPALSSIGDYFSEASTLTVKMVLSLPPIIIIPMTLITGRLIFYVKKKTLLYIGLTLNIIGGLGGGLQNSIEMLLVFRAIMGLGVGILLPLSTGIIADFFHGSDRSRMMGYSTSFNNLGGIISTILAGVLTIYGWRYPFLVYTLGIIVFILVMFYLPNQDIDEKPSHKPDLNKNVWILGFCGFVMIQLFFALPSSLVFFLKTEGYGEGVLAGFMISLITIGSFTFGLLFHRIKAKLKSSTPFVGVSLISIGMLLVGVVGSVYLIGFALLIVGFGLGITAPNLYLQTSLDVNKKDVTLALAVVASFNFLGQFSSPIILEFIQNITNYKTSSSLFIISFIMGVVSLGLVLLNKLIKVYVPKKQSI